MSQRRLAELIGMQPSVFSKRLTGAVGFRSFTLTEIDLIAEKLAVPVDRFLTAPAEALSGGTA